MISVEFIPNIGSKRNLHWAVAGRYPWILCCCIPSHIFLWNRCWQPKDKENDCKCVVNDSMEDTRSHFQASSRIHSYMLSQRKNESKEEWILKKIHIAKTSHSTDFNRHERRKKLKSEVNDGWLAITSELSFLSLGQRSRINNQKIRMNYPKALGRALRH